MIIGFARMNIIRFREKISTLRKEQRLHGEKILAAPEAVVYLSAAELAGRLGTSYISIVRFCKNMGFSGYPEMREMFKQQLGISRVPTEFAKTSLHTMLSHEQRALEKTITSSVHAKIGQAVLAIDKCESVIIAGYGASSVLAELLSGYLEISGIRAVWSRNSRLDLLSRIFDNSHSRTALIVINVLKYFRDIVEAEEKARANGLRVIAITDSLFSPVAIRADVVIPVCVERPEIIYTLAPLVAVIGEIGTRLAGKRKKQAKKYLSLADKIWKEDLFVE